MDTRYILPATVAAAIHAIALLGFNNPATHVLPASSEPGCTLPPAEPPVIEVKDLEDKPAAADAVEDRGPKGDPEIARPGLDEPEPRPTVNFPLPPPPRGPRVETTRIVPPGIAGWIDGNDAGERRGTPAVDFRALDDTPRVRARVAPVYPSELRAAGVDGEVTVGLLVDESGSVLRAWVVHSTDRRFEETTLRAVGHWRFTPGKRDGRPVRFRMELPVRFAVSRE